LKNARFHPIIFAIRIFSSFKALRAGFKFQGTSCWFQVSGFKAQAPFQVSSFRFDFVELKVQGASGVSKSLLIL
jgi:hypothetical protein